MRIYDVPAEFEEIDKIAASVCDCFDKDEAIAKINTVLNESVYSGTNRLKLIAVLIKDTKGDLQKIEQEIHNVQHLLFLLASQASDCKIKLQIFERLALDLLTGLGVTKWKDYMVRVSKWHSERVQIEDQASIPEAHKYMIEHVKKGAIKEAIKKGETVPGARLKRVDHVRVR